MKRIALFVLTLLIGTAGFAENKMFQDSDFGVSFPIPEGLMQMVSAELTIPIEMKLNAYASEMDEAPEYSLVTLKVVLDEEIDADEVKDTVFYALNEFGFFDEYSCNEMPSKMQGARCLRLVDNDFDEGALDMHIFVDGRNLLLIMTAVDETEDFSLLDDFTNTIAESVVRDAA